MTVRLRGAAAALAFAGVMFVLYPAVRPWHDESTAAGARESMSATSWVAAHFFAMLGFIAVPLGVLAVRTLLASVAPPGGVAPRLAGAAFLLTWIGAGLVLPYYGAEDFGLHAVARSDVGDLLSVVDLVRYWPLSATMFALGLATLGVGAVLTAVAVWRSTILPRTSGLLFAVGFGLFIPQFYLPAAFRIAHGVVVGLGCLWLAVILWRVPGGANPAPNSMVNPAATRL